jgi:hypothetical protein
MGKRQKGPGEPKAMPRQPFSLVPTVRSKGGNQTALAEEPKEEESD